LNIFALFIWSFKIVRERGKSTWVALFLLFPVTSLFAFLYLAFSDEAPVGMETASSMLVFETA
jgi:hypothetical protein